MAILTTQAVSRACDADHVRLSPWQRLTRRDSSVSLDRPPALHEWREPFDLWESVQYQGFRRRHMEGVTG